jgi:hypothetical protein
MSTLGMLDGISAHESFGDREQRLGMRRHASIVAGRASARCVS